MEIYGTRMKNLGPKSWIKLVREDNEGPVRTKHA